MNGKPKQLRILSFAAGCVVIVLSAFLCGCESETDRKARESDREAHGHLDDGVEHLEAGRYAEALAACRKAIVLKPDFADAYCGVGCACFRLKKYPDALAAFMQAVALEPDNMFAHSYMGSCYEKLEQYSHAIAAFRKVIAIKPGGKYAYLARQHIRELSSKRDELRSE